MPNKHDELLDYLIDQVNQSKSTVNNDIDVDSFYWSSDWVNKRKQIKARDNAECQLCKANGMVNRQRLVVHHIVPLRVNFDLRLDNSNLITLCFNCHETVEGRLFTRQLEADGGEWW